MSSVASSIASVSFASSPTVVEAVEASALIIARPETRACLIRSGQVGQVAQRDRDAGQDKSDWSRSIVGLPAELIELVSRLELRLRPRAMAYETDHRLPIRSRVLGLFWKYQDRPPLSFGCRGEGLDGPGTRDEQALDCSSSHPTTQPRARAGDEQLVRLVRQLIEQLVPDSWWQATAQKLARQAEQAELASSRLALRPSRSLLDRRRVDLNVRLVRQRPEPTLELSLHSLVASAQDFLMPFMATAWPIELPELSKQLLQRSGLERPTQYRWFELQLRHERSVPLAAVWQAHELASQLLGHLAFWRALFARQLWLTWEQSFGLSTEAQGDISTTATRAILDAASLDELSTCVQCLLVQLALEGR